jgi:PAS domain S-box-containing protein
MEGQRQGSVTLAVLEAAVDAMITIDDEGLVLQLNSATERIFGFRASEMLGKPLCDLVIPSRMRDAHREGLRRVISGGSSRILRRRIEMPAVRADGVEIRVELTVSRTAEAPPQFTAWIRDAAEQGETAAVAHRAALLDRAEQLASMGSWEWGLESDELLWSDHHYRLFGVEPRAITPSLEYLLDNVYPADRQRVERGIEIARQTGVMPSVEYRVMHADGTIRHLRARSTTIERRPPQRLLHGIVEDLTERRQAEREVAAHCAVSESLDTWDSLERSGVDLLRNLGEALGYEVGGLWLPDRGVLVNRLLWCRPRAEVDDFAEASRGLRFPPGVGLIGRVWESREPIHLVNVRDQHGDHPRRDAAARVGLRGAMALAAQNADEVLAVLDFYTREEAPLSERLMRLLTDIGSDLGRFFARRRADLAPPPLTPRQLEVLQLAADGLSGRAIAERLVVSAATIKTHFANIYSKLEVSDRASAVATGLRQGLIQ